MDYFTELISIIKKEHPSKEKLSKIKTKLCKKHKLKNIPTDIEVLLNSPKKDLDKIKDYIITKPTRSMSGVAVIAIMSKPHECPHGRCKICPGGPNSIFGDVPQSYTGKEPATRRAIRNDYDPYLQVMNRLEQYVVQGHVPEKVELIVMGGTFPSLKKTYQEEFIKNCFKAMNDFSDLFFKKLNSHVKKGPIRWELSLDSFKRFFDLPSKVKNKERERKIKSKLLKEKRKNKKDLEKEQKKNETAKIRCIGLTLETRPDYAAEKHAEEMLKLGCTRVELGVQTVYDEILKHIERGHSVVHSIHSTRILKDLGFKINYHVMPGLPRVDFHHDLKALNELFTNPDFRPDMLKIYPCMVLKGTKIYKSWLLGNYEPLTTEKAAELISEFKRNIPEYVRIMRVQRDIPTMMTEAGVDMTNLRQYVEQQLKKKNISCRCIRCREIGRSGETPENHELKITEYTASHGKEFFIAAEKNDSIIGFCRLRFPSGQLRKEITKHSALVRELHVYGETTSLGKKGKTQHKGIGKELLKKAEDIAKQYNKNKIVVISGIGAREYYRKLGYKKEGVYMVKKI